MNSGGLRAIELGATTLLREVLAVVVAWLVRARRPIAPKRGALTVSDVQARLAREADEIQSKIRAAREAEFTRLAEATTQSNLDADTQVMARIPADAPDPIMAPVTVPPRESSRLSSSKRARPYAGLKPRPYPVPRSKSFVA